MTRHTAEDGPRTTEQKFYTPAGSTDPLVADRLGWLWRAVFGHGVDGPA
jgi:hypothetical protein